MGGGLQEAAWGIMLQSGWLAQQSEVGVLSTYTDLRNRLNRNRLAIAKWGALGEAGEAKMDNGIITAISTGTPGDGDGGGGGADPVGLAAAQAAQDAVAPDTVILFGSRARGDHRPDSDVDLLVIHEGNGVSAAGRAKRAVKAYFKANPPRLGCDIVTITRERFHYACRAQNHVAGQALRDGTVMNGERLDHENGRDGGQGDGRGDGRDGGYPRSWPDVRERIRAAYRHLGTFDREITHPDGYQENYGFHGQQAVENALKGWLSAAGISYGRSHDIEELADEAFADPAESATLAGAQLKSLMDYTGFPNLNYPGERDNWLTRYAVAYRYSGTAHRMDDLEQTRFREEIVLAVVTFINRAHELTGTDGSDL